MEDSSFGEKRNAFMKIIQSIFTNNDSETITLTKVKITDMMRAITDYCANDKYLYKNHKRSQQTYRYSKSAWIIKDTQKNAGLVGDHCVPLNCIFEFLADANKKTPLSADEIRKFLDYHLEIVMITKEEDNKLNGLKLKSKMPTNWEWFGEKYLRYNYADIEIEEASMKNSLSVRTL